MKKRNRLLSSFLALSMVIGSLTPSLALASSSDQEPIISGQDDISEEYPKEDLDVLEAGEDEELLEETQEEKELNPEEGQEEFSEEVEQIDFDLDEYKDTVIQLTEEINEIDPANDEEAQMIEEFNKSSEELFDMLLTAESLENQANGISTYALTPDILAKIKNLDSVPQRMELFITMSSAIKFSTSEIRYKGPDAQLKMTAYISTGLLKVVNEYTTVDEMKAYILKFDALKEELLALPDLPDDARANMYLRVDMDKKIAKAKDMINDELEDKSTHVIDKLEKEIDQARRVRRRSKTSVKEIRLAFDSLDASVQEALDSTDLRADKEEIEILKALRNDLKRERIIDERRDYVNDLIRRVNKEVALKRPSKAVVLELTQEIQDIMAFQEANTASEDQIKELKDLKIRLEKARINDQRRTRVREIIREANMELANRRPNKEKVQNLIVEIKIILEPQRIEEQ